MKVKKTNAYRVKGVYNHTENNKRENTAQELNCNYYENRQILTCADLHLEICVIYVMCFTWFVSCLGAECFAIDSATLSLTFTSFSIFPFVS